MIELSRGLARRFRAVLRRSLLESEPRGSWPLLLVKAGPGGLTMQSQQGHLAVQYRQPSVSGSGAIAFRSDMLARFESPKAGPVSLEQVAFGKGSARWTEAGVPQVLDLETVVPESVPEFPALPRQFTPMPGSFLQALVEAAQTTARSEARYALSRLQLRGESGQVIATDGKQLLVQRGFSFPWKDDVLVPRVSVFGGRELVGEEPVEVGRTASHVVLRVGCWTFFLPADTTARFPDTNAVIPRLGPQATRLQLAPDDVAYLLVSLPKLPGRDDDYSPITLDLTSPAAIRARDSAQGQVTEVVLTSSTVSGSPVRLNLARQYLLRALKLGFTEVLVTGADKPMLCKDQQRLYLWMALSSGDALSPDKDTLRLTSGAITTKAPVPTNERRETAMPAPQPIDRIPDKDHTNGQQAERTGLEEIIGEVDALRTLLQEASTRTARLHAALKQQRRQSRAVQAAVASLRQLKLDH